MKTSPDHRRVCGLKPISEFRWLTLGTAALSGLAAWQLKSVLAEAGILEYPVWQTGLILLRTGLLATAALLVLAAVTPLANWLTGGLQKLGGWLARFRVIVILLLLLDAGGLLYVTLGPFYTYQAGKLVQALFIWLAGLAVALLLKVLRPQQGLLFWLAGGVLGAGFLLQIGVLFSQVSNYPFSETWSEGMLLFNAAQFAGQKIWGQPVSWPVMNRSHALLQALSFLIPGNQPLWFHRLWNAILWSCIPVGVMIALGKRLGVNRSLPGLFLILWGFLFLNQGPVYFNLLVIPIIILVGFRSNRFGLSLVVVLLASAWAGISRINWYPMPGALALVLFVLEEPYQGGFWKYFWKPATFMAFGVAAAFAVDKLYRAAAGILTSHTIESIQSTLLWYRLFPSSTFPLGVLPALVIVTSGLLILVGWQIFARGDVHFWRKLSLAVTLAVFLLGGLLVSTKIGGGNNLHNLDAFLVLLTVCAAYAFFNRIAPDTPEQRARQIPGWLTAVMIALPIFYLSPLLPFKPAVNQSTIERLEAQLEERVNEARAAGKPVLFISQTQMLAINRFPGVSPEPQYELVWMMEMAMVGKQQYFSEFYDHLARHEWGLIVIDSLSMREAEGNQSFGEEQDAWVKWVVEPIRAYYIPVGGNPQAQMILAVPRE